MYELNLGYGEVCFFPIYYECFIEKFVHKGP